MPTGELVRNVAFVTFLTSLLADSWSHPETRTQATTWGLIIHTLFFGSSSQQMRDLLHGPSFFYAHSVLAGWLQLTCANPEIDRADKEKAWGRGSLAARFALLRTLVVHVLTVVAHHVLLRVDGPPRGRRGSSSLFSVLLRDVAPQLAVLLTYKHLYYDIKSTYGVTSMSLERLHNWQSAVIFPMTAAMVPLWRGALASLKER